MVLKRLVDLSTSSSSKNGTSIESAVYVSGRTSDRCRSAGSNGTGKSTFFETFLADCGLRFINADVIADGLEITAYAAAEMAASIRSSLVSQRESFVFETVLSDPIGDKVNTLAKYSDAGYTVVLLFIKVQDVNESIRRVAMRVSQGGHDFPDEKLKSRFERTKANLQRALARLPHVLVYDNSDLELPYRLVSVYEHGKPANDY